MTKIGEGEMPSRPTEEMAHKKLQENITRFENALSGYQVRKDSKEAEHLSTLMNQQMELINSNVNEIKRLGIHKQGDVVFSDYQHYRNDPTSANLTILQQDLTTLKEYNYKPD